jgi:drug/metabolite transporter (DMT)-like permease
MKLRIGMALFAVYVIWGSTYLAISIAVQTIPPFLMAGTRFLIAGSILYLWQKLRGVPTPNRLEWRSAAIVAGFMLVGGNGFLTWAEQYVPSGIAALLVGTVPLWMALIDALVIPGAGRTSGLLAFIQRAGKPLVGGPVRKRPNWLSWLGLLIGFAGIVLLIGPRVQEPGTGSRELIGLGMLILVSLSWSIGSLYSRGARLPDAPLMGTGMEMLVASLGFAVLATLNGEWGRIEPAAISTRSLLSLGYLIVFGGLIGFVAYTWLLRNISTPVVAAHAYVNPMIAILLGSLIVQEPLTPRIIFSAAVIIGSVVLISLARALPARQSEKLAIEPAPGND